VFFVFKNDEVVLSTGDKDLCPNGVVLVHGSLLETGEEARVH